MLSNLSKYELQQIVKNEKLYQRVWDEGPDDYPLWWPEPDPDLLYEAEKALKNGDHLPSLKNEG